MLKRHIAKTITYRLLSSMIGFGVVYIISDSHVNGLIFSFIELIYKPLQYFIHERIWYKYIRFGLKNLSGEKLSKVSGTQIREEQNNHKNPRT